MIRLLKCLFKKHLTESEYTNKETVYNDNRYRMEYHGEYECYDAHYYRHREYEYWNYK